jgi:ribosomal protein S18 acetylase RimI-like enzyme
VTPPHHLVPGTTHRRASGLSRRRTGDDGPGPLTRLRRHLARRERFDVFALAPDALEPDAGPPRGIETRAVSPGDAGALAPLVPEHETRERLMHGDLGLMAVADDGRVVGCSWIAARPMAAHHHLVAIRPGRGEAYGYDLQVEPAMRRRGVGRALVQAGRRRAFRTGARSVLSHVEFSNDASEALMRSTGATRRRRVSALVVLDRFSVVLHSTRPGGTDTIAG